MKPIRIVIYVGIFCLLYGCGNTVKKGYTNPSYSISAVRTIAILPFDGVADADVAADMIAMVLANQGTYKVVDRAQIASTLIEHNLPRDLLSTDTIIEKGKLINADAFLKGRVTRFQQGKAAYPIATQTIISMSLKLVSAETGQIIWTQLYSKKSGGRGLLAPDVDEMMIEMAEEITSELVKLR